MGAQVVPVLLGALPLQEDLDEAEAVYGSLCGLLLHPDTSPRVAPLLPQILQVPTLCKTCPFTSCAEIYGT